MENKKRLIDAYTFAEEIESLQITVAGKPARWNDAKHSVLRKIAEQPAIDAVVLPCKVGDTVHIVGDKFPAEIEEISITKDGVFFEYVELDRSYEITEVWDSGYFQAEDIGKKVFLTFEEVEAALAKMDGERKENGDK